MKNADRPAYPKTKGEHDCEFTTTDCHGLTKREMIAAMAMSGILSNPSCIPTEQVHFSNISEDAIRAADELLKKLES